MFAATKLSSRYVRGVRPALLTVLLAAVLARAGGEAIPVRDVGLAGLGGACVFDGGVTQAVVLRDAEAVVYVFAVKEGHLAVRVSRNGGTSFAECGVAGTSQMPIPAEHLATASSTNMLASVYVTARDALSAIRLVPAAGPALLPLHIGAGEPTGSGEVTDLYAGSEPVARHFLAFVRHGRLEWSIVDPVGLSAQNGVVEMPGEVTAIRSASDHSEPLCRFHLVMVSCLVGGSAREAIVVIDGEHSVYLQDSRCLGEAGVVVTSLQNGLVGVYGASGAALRTASVARLTPGVEPTLTWGAEVALGFGPRWLRGFASPHIADAFCLGAGDGSRMAVIRVTAARGDPVSTTETAADAVGVSPAGSSLALHRLDSTGGRVRLSTDHLALSGSGAAVAGETVDLGASGREARFLVDVGTRGIVWRETQGPRVVLEGESGSRLIRRDPTSHETVELSLPFALEGIDVFRRLEVIEGELLLDQETGSGVFLRLAVDAAGELRSGVCARFAGLWLDYDSPMLLRSRDGSVWALTK
jgi:hypothetical protein